MPITALQQTDTFRTWYNRTNEIIDQLNTKVLSDNATVNGVFTIGTGSLSVANLFSVNTTSIVLKGTTVLSSNVTINSSANIVNIAAGSLLINANTVVNNPLTVNAALAITGNTNAVGSLTRTGDESITGNVAVTGGVSVANGALTIRNVTFGSPSSTLSPAPLTNPSYNDYNPAGLTECQLLALTPNIDTVITGIQAPSIVGSRMLFIQNMSGTYKITFPSGNTASAASNRFKTPSDNPIDLPPGALMVALWSSTASQWRLLNPSVSLFNSTLTGNTVIAGPLTVNSGATFATANVSFGSALYIDFINSRVGVKISNPAYDFQVSGNSYFGVTTIAGATTLSAPITATANASLGNGALSLNATGNTATFANTITANGSSQSYVRSLKSTSFVVDDTTTTANLTATAKATLSGTLVIPVGANKWATA